jgi:hypothetical protein
MWKRRNESICFFMIAVLSLAGCTAETPAPKQVRRPVERPVSRKLAVVSPAFLSPEMEQMRQASHGSMVEFARDGAGLVYIEPVDGKFRVVHNGRAGKQYLAITELLISSDGTRVAYVAAINDHLNKVVVDGKEGFAFGPDDNHWFTPDGKHHVSTVVEEGEKYILVDGRVLRDRRIQLSPEISPDSRMIAFSNKAEGRNQFIISDLAMQNKTVFDYCGEYILPNDDRTLLAVGCLQDGKSSMKVVDFLNRSTVSESRYDGTVTHIRFSPYQRSLAYTYVKNENQRYVIYNGREERIPAGDEFMTDPVVLAHPESVGVIIGDVYKVRFYRAFQQQDKNSNVYGFISDLVPSRDGRHYAYVATPVGGVQMHIVADGQEGPKFDKIVSPVFSPDSRLLVYRARQAGKRFVVVSDLKGKIIRRYRDYDMVFQPVFSADGKSIAYGVLDGNELWWKVETVEQQEPPDSGKREEPERKK